MSTYSKYTAHKSSGSSGSNGGRSGLWGRLTTPVKVGVGVVSAVAAVGGFVAVAVNSLTTELDTLAYRDSLITVGGGDLPAPPFIGWSQEFVESPPERLQTSGTITNVSNPECEPGGERQAELYGLVMENASRWSATELFNAAYNSQIRVDASDSYIKSNGLDYGVVDRWLDDCGFVSFDQGDKTIRITNKPLDVDMGVWDFSDGRAWVQTVATTTAQGFQGASSTITTLGNAPGVTLQAQLTFRGRADDNAVATMDLLWSSQAMKALQTQKDSAK